MKKINFELLFKIIVIVQLTTIILMLIYSTDSSESTTLVDPNEFGRYKEIKTKTFYYGRETGEIVRILDTKTGKYVKP